MSSDYSSLPHSSFRFEKIVYQKSRYRATITINRPEVHNCLDLQTLQELGAAFQDAAWDDRVAVVVITGAGEKAFCTGALLAAAVAASTAGSLGSIPVSSASRPGVM